MPDQSLGVTKFCNLVEDIKNRLLLIITGKLLYAIEWINNSTFMHSLNLSHVYKPSDSLILSSVYEVKIAELEARIAALEAK